MCIGKRGSFTKMKFWERKAFVIKWTIFRFLAGNNMRQKRKKKMKRKTFFKLRWNTKKAAVMLRFSKAPSRRHSINYTFFPLTMEISFESVFSLSFIHSLYCFFFVVLTNKETNEQKMELRKNHNWNYLNKLSYVAWLGDESGMLWNKWIRIKSSINNTMQLWNVNNRIQQ